MKVDFSFACPKRWNAMSGGEEARHCASCDKTVHNLSALGPRRSRQLLQSAAAGEVCVTALHDRDRNVVFDRRLFRLAAATPLLALSGAALADGEIPDLTASSPIEELIEVTDEMIEDVDDADCNKPVGPGDYTPEYREEPVYITAGVYIDPGPPVLQPPPPPPEPEPPPEPAADAETSG